MRYYTIVRFVDIDTGEEISKNQFRNNYYKIKTIKNAQEPNIKEGFRIIELITEARRKSRQGTIKFPNPRN